jgi:hypothetical protein
VGEFEEYARRAGVQRSARSASTSELFDMSVGTSTAELEQQLSKILRDSNHIRHIVTWRFHIWNRRAVIVSIGDKTVDVTKMPFPDMIKRRKKRAGRRRSKSASKGRAVVKSQPR